MSKTIIADIRNDKFPPLAIRPGTYVVWRNLDSYAHSAEMKPDHPGYFTAGAMLPGETSSPILFEKPGTYPYLCRFHTGMTGSVTVAEDATDPGTPDEHDHGHEQGSGHGTGHGHGYNHYHGFVTGGRLGSRLFLSHTPVLADERHNYQVILRARFAEAAHAMLYEELRATDYGDQVVQIFHDHMSMPDIGTGKITRLPNASVSYWPGGKQTTIGPEQKDVPGLEDVPVEIEEVLHFHQFRTEEPYPDALTYVMYGDGDDVFVDHLINGAPSFHSVAKLARAPVGWSGRGARTFTVPGRAMRALPPRLVSHIAMVDNAFHLFWLLPPGALIRQAQDPLIVRGNAAPGHSHAIVYEDGQASEIEISRFLHFDIRLLNYGVLIAPDP